LKEKRRYELGIEKNKGKIEIIKASFGRGIHRVNTIGIVTGDKGLIVGILGGGTPHVGAISLAIPRPSLKDPQMVSATSSILTLMGHKDDEIARPISEMLARKLNQAVVVVAGVHTNAATEQDIKILIRNSNQAAHKLIKKICSSHIW
jgi:cell division GTPase FtsZ